MDDGENSKNRVEDLIENEFERRALGLGKKILMAGTRSVLAGSGAIIAPGIATIVVLVIAVPIVMFFTGFVSQGSQTSSGKTETKANIKFRCQYDPRWTVNSCNITTYGCHPTALSSVMASFGDTTWNPLSVARVNNMGCEYPGTTSDKIRESIEWVKSQGYKVAKENFARGQTFEIDQAKIFLDKGYLLLGVANIPFRTSGPIKSGGHSFVITGVDPSSGNLTVLDPTYCTSDEDFSVRTLNLNEVLCDSQGCGWYYAYAIKR